MVEITQADKIRVIAEDIYDAMTQKELDDFVIWQITASLEQLPESDVNEMYGEILSEIAY
jgi:DNA-binding protein Fis